MKKDIHPQMHEVTAKCNCGFEITIMTTRPGDLSLEVCSRCHPLFTGKQKLVDTSGQVEKFRRRFGRTG